MNPPEHPAPQEKRELSPEEKIQIVETTVREELFVKETVSRLYRDAGVKALSQAESDEFIATKNLVVRWFVMKI